MGEFRHLSDDPVYAGYIWTVVQATFESPDGDRFQRDVVRSPGAVATVPVRRVDDQIQVTLVNQYRAAYAQQILEIPAGMRDIPGEPPAVTANRELVEEAGLRAARLTPLIEFYPSAGMSDSVLHLFLATDLTDEPRQAHGVEESHMDVLSVPLDEAMTMVLDGRIRDAKTVIGLLLVERMHRAGTLDC